MVETRPVGKARIERVTWSPDAPWRWEIADPTAWRFHAGYACTWDAALFAAGVARRRIVAGRVPHPDPPDPAEWAGGCVIRGCRCSDPSAWLVCGEWAGIDEETGRGCPRCGWSRTVHPDPVTETGDSA